MVGRRVPPRALNPLKENIVNIASRLGCLALMALCMISSALWNPAVASTPLLQDPEEEAAAQRQAYGFFEVVQADALVKDFQAGRISEAAFTAEIWEQYPVLTANLYALWGSLNSCFLRDLVFGQTNGVIAADASGNAIFFDAAQYVGTSGQPLPGRAREYNAAVRANTILRGLQAEWNADPVCQTTKMLDNMCCRSSATVTCQPRTGARCGITDDNLNCVNSSTHCN